jgi:hypothetical protein
MYSKLHGVHIHDKITFDTNLQLVRWHLRVQQWQWGTLAKSNHNPNKCPAVFRYSVAQDVALLEKCGWTSCYPRWPEIVMVCRSDHYVCKL